MKFRAGDLEAQAARTSRRQHDRRNPRESRLPSTLDEYRTRIEKDLEAAGVTLLDASTMRIGRISAYRTDFRLPLKAPDDTVIPDPLRGAGDPVTEHAVPRDDRVPRGRRRPAHRRGPRDGPTAPLSRAMSRTS